MKLSINVAIVLLFSSLAACIPAPDGQVTLNQSFVNLNIDQLSSEYSGDGLDPFMRVTQEIEAGKYVSILTLSWNKFSASDEYQNRLEVRFPGSDLTTHEQGDAAQERLIMHLEIAGELWNSLDCATTLNPAVFDPPMNVTITEFSTASDGRVKGNFSGMVCPDQDINPNSPERVISGNFDVPFFNSIQ